MKHVLGFTMVVIIGGILLLLDQYGIFVFQDSYSHETPEDSRVSFKNESHGGDDPEIIVKSEDGFNPQLIEGIEGVEKVSQDEDFIVVDVSDSKEVEEVIEEIESIDGVSYADENAIFSITNTAPNDPYYGNDYDKQWSLPRINAHRAWDRGQGSGTYIVAVTDTGVDWNHEDIIENMWVNEGEIIPMFAANLTDFTNIDDVNSNGIIDCEDLYDVSSGNRALVKDGNDDDSNTFDDDYCGWDFVNNDNNPNDDHGHGTHVAGIIGAVGNNSTGVSGSVWDVKIMALKFIDATGNGNLYDGVDAIDYALDNGAHIVNMSWRGTSSAQSLQDKLTEAYNGGLIPVAAAGNDYGPVDEWYPSAMNDVLTVGATNSLDNRASYSNYGIKVEIAAPGSHILSLKAGGTSVGSCSSHSNSKYKYCGGTSMATPLVSGAAVLVWEQNGSLTNAQVMQILMENTASFSPDQYSGRGLLNANKAVNNPSTAASEVSEVTSRMSVDMDEQTVGGSVNVTVTIKDGDGTLLNGRTVYVESSRGNPDTILPSTDTTDVLGEASFTLSSTTSGELYLTAYDTNGTGGNTSDDYMIAYMTTVEYDPGPHTKFGFASISGMNTKISKSVKIYAQDQYGNTVPSFLNKANLSDKSGRLNISRTDNFSSGIWTGQVKVDSYYLNNKLTATYNAKTGKSKTFNVTHPNVTLSSVSQSYGYRSYSRYSRTLTIKGSNFRNGLTIKLKRSGHEISCSSVSLQSASQFTCKANTLNGSAGYWNVYVRNLGISTTARTLSNKFGIYRRSDLNRDWSVDIFDFSQLLGEWGRNDAPISDMIEDDIVDVLDFSIMLGEWIEAY